MRKREYPTLALEPNKILKVVESINKFGGSAPKKQIIEDTGIKVGLGIIIASAKQYGLITREESSVNLILTDLGKAYCLAADDEGKRAAIIRTILNVPQYKRIVLEKNFYKEPSLSVLRQIMIKYGIPQKDAGFVASAFRRNLTIWGFTFSQLKASEGLSEIIGPEETVGAEAFQATGSIEPTRRSDLIPGMKLSWTISYLKQTHKDLDKENLTKVLDNMLAQSSSFKELKKEIESTKKFSQYSDEKAILAYIKDNFENALAKDLGIEKLSDLVEVEGKKPKAKKGEEIVENTAVTDNRDR